MECKDSKKLSIKSVSIRKDSVEFIIYIICYHEFNTYKLESIVGDISQTVLEKSIKSRKEFDKEVKLLSECFTAKIIKR